MHIQNIRHKLQKRVGQLHLCTYADFAAALKRFLVFIDSDVMLKAAVAEIERSHPELEAKLEENGRRLLGDTDLEHAAIGWFVMKRTAEGKQGQGLDFTHWVDFRRSIDEQLKAFVSAYVDPFYEELDERLSDGNQVLSELIRFKHLAEWFRRDELFQLWKSATNRGEKLLGWKLYEHLYIEGIDFSIEPTSISGEADMVSSQTADHPLVADVKIYMPPNKGGSYIKQGLQQIHTYLQDFNQSIGYMIVFNVSDKQLQIESTVAGSEVPIVQLNTKSIFVVAIDLYPHAESASKRALEVGDSLSRDEFASLAVPKGPEQIV